MGDTTNSTEVEVEVAETAEQTPASEVVSEETEVSTVEESSGEADSQNKQGDPTDAPVEEDDDDEAYYYPKVYAENIFGKMHKALDKGWEWVKEKLHLPTLTRKQKAAIWDKITTGILIFLFCTPLLILIYILLWFVFK